MRQKSKRFVAKIMVLTAVTRPRGGSFNGVLGSWRVVKPFIYKRKTTFQGKTYLAGEHRLADCEMDGDLFATMLKEKVIPAIRAKMSSAKNVGLQMDNAGGHGMKTIANKIADALPARVHRGKQQGPNIILKDQPAQSPDTNVCDLGLFRSVDSQIPNKRPYQLDEFEEMVVAAHRNYPDKLVTALFETKAAVCAKILVADGDNMYDLHHRRRHVG